MSDQNKFDQYKEKFLHYWSLFLAACGKIWDKTKYYIGTAAEFLRTNGKALLQKIAALLVTARQRLRKQWAVVCKYVQQALQRLAAWALMIREKAQPRLLRAKEWITVRTAKAREWLGVQAAKVKGYLPVKAKEEAPALPAAAEALSVVEEASAVEPEMAAVVAPVVEAEPEITAEPEPEPRKPLVTNPTLLKILAVLGIIGKYLKLTLKWIWKLRTVFMAIPVVVAAIRLAMLNMARLPESVGLDIQASGEFARMISRTEAVYWPLGLTAFCLLLMFCSKKPLLPWVVSIFTLVMPVLIWVLNSYA